MKKIFLSLLAIAALTACSKSDVQYSDPAEIGFAPVSGNITKAAVADAVYPTSLGMIVSSWNDNASTTDVTEYIPYFTNADFIYKQDVTTNEGSKKAWGGVPAQYWPNVNSLSFMGISASTGVTDATVNMYPVAAGTNAANTISITGYTQGEPVADTDASKGVDDLMWFPLTPTYKKETKAVPVTMYHALSLLKFQVQGDAVTGVTGSSYKVTNITINTINKSGDVVLGGTNHSATWTLSTTESNLVVYNDDGVGLAGTFTGTETNPSYSPTVVENVDNGILVLPQTPTTINITYQYTSGAGETITEVAEDLPLTLTDNSAWDDGYKYTYTITIKANEILIAPTPEAWADGTSGSVTIE